MKTIRHYTLNTGNMTESSAFETDKQLYFTMKKIIDRAKKQKTELLDNTYIEIVEESLGYVCTLYGKRGKDYLPILSTAGTKNPDGRFYIWNNLQDVARAEFKNQYIDKVPASEPGSVRQRRIFLRGQISAQPRDVQDRPFVGIL